MHSQARTPQEFPALTGVRALAATMVFIDHFNFFKPRWVGQPAHDFVREFHVGVTIFFVLSGFLICYRYEEQIRQGKQWLYQYLVNRFARIFPMYFLFTVVAFWPGWCRNFCSFDVFLLNITFLRGFFDEWKFTGVATGWSLTVEEMFYFLFPAIILGARMIRLRIQPLLFIGAGLVLWIAFSGFSFHGFFGSLRFLFEFTFFGRCVEFYVGMMLARYVRSSGLTQHAKRPIFTAAGLIFMALCISGLALNRRLSTSEIPFILMETLINNIILPFGIATFFLGLITEGSWIRIFLSNSFVRLLGRSSYIFYLIHNGIFFYFFHFYLGWRIPFVYLALQCTSVTFYLLAERPLNLGIRKWALGRREVIRHAYSGK